MHPIYKRLGLKPGSDLSKEIPQVANRARAYELEDDGASDLSRRKRCARRSITGYQHGIARIRDRQNGLSVLPPMDAKDAGRLIDNYTARIAELREQIAETGPATPLVAPVARRVAREDRRRRRAELKQNRQGT